MTASKGMVSGHREALAQTSKDALGIMSQRRSFSVEPFASGGDLAAIDVEDTLPFTTVSPLETPYFDGREIESEWRLRSAIARGELIN